LVFSLATFNLGRSPSERRGSLQVQSEDGRGVDKPFFHAKRKMGVCGWPGEELDGVLKTRLLWWLICELPYHHVDGTGASSSDI